MTTTHRPPKTMTQVLRPSCELHALPEVHSYFGPGINNFGSPCLMVAEMAVWYSTGTVWDEARETSAKSSTVFAANDALLKQGSQAKGRKHHFLFAVGQSLLPPAPVAVWGMAGMHLPGEWVDPIKRDNAESTAIFAPRHVKADVAGTEEVATLRYFGGGHRGPGNLAVCCDPFDHPATFASQTPNTVFLGMSQADTWGSQIGWLLATLANGLLKMLVDHVVGHFSELAAKYLRRALAAFVIGVVRQCLAALRYVGVTAAGFAAGAALDRLSSAFFNVDSASFDHTAIDDGIADLWDEYVVSP